MKAINFRLYLYELIFAALLLFVHTRIDIGDIYFDSLGRATVVFFFIFSAYFYCRFINKEGYSYKKTLFKCLRLLIIFAITITIYYFIYLPIRINDLGRPALFDSFTFDNLISFFSTYYPVSEFLWFILSLIGCYLLFPFINKIKFIHHKKAIILPISILLAVYVFRIFAGKYSLVVGNYSFSNYQLTRNAIFTGLPCFLIGSYIYDNLMDIKKIPSKIFYPVLIALFVTQILEAYLHNLIGTRKNEFYISSLAIATLVTIYSLQNGTSPIGERLFKVIGPHGPSLIYLTHILFLELYERTITFKHSFLLIIPLTILSTLILTVAINQIALIINKRKTE